MRKLRFIASLYILWCLYVGTKETWSMMKGVVADACLFILNLL